MKHNGKPSDINVNMHVSTINMKTCSINGFSYKLGLVLSTFLSHFFRIIPGQSENIIHRTWTTCKIIAILSIHYKVEVPEGPEKGSMHKYAKAFVKASTAAETPSATAASSVVAVSVQIPKKCLLVKIHDFLKMLFF